MDDATRADGLVKGLARPGLENRPRRAQEGRVTPRVRMADVARLAKVAPATVSRVLRRPDIVSEETRGRVLQAIRDLHYVPDMVAGSLASNRTGIVAMIVPTLTGSIFAETAAGTASVLRARGYELLLGNSGYDAVEEEELVKALLSRRPDGFILTGSQHTKGTRTMLRQAGIPVVETWELPARPIDMAVGFDNRAAARAIIEFLASRGYRRIAMIARPAGTGTRNDQRIQGYGDAVAALGLPDGLLFPSGEDSALRGGAVSIGLVLSARPRIDAVFCADDIHALGALFECGRRGRSVPGDIALAGFGDFDVAAEATPSLTTVRVPGPDIGRRAAERVLARLDGEATVEEPAVQDLGFEVMPRESA
jgi:LacI family transcriptional regulator, gluconate utilization system Gnt-I transcriptional repressor